jgi:hypothetical protein
MRHSDADPVGRFIFNALMSISIIAQLRSQMRFLLRLLLRSMTNPPAMIEVTYASSNLDHTKA